MKNLDDLALSEREKKAIAKATRMLRERFPVEEALPLRYKARGDDDEESDIDLMLLTTRPIHWRERQTIIHALFDLSLSHDVIFSILDTTVDEFDDGLFSVFPVHDEITRDGVVVT